MLPIGTRIRFTKTLDHPDIVLAYRGDTGEITGHGTPEGYWVKADGWPAPFGASRDEFEPLKQNLKQTERKP